VDALTTWFEALPAVLAYGALGLGAALENIVPAVPADTFVVLGGFLSERSGLNVVWVFLATWSANVGGALAMYWLGHRHGRIFFEYGWGRRLLNPTQMGRLQRFFEQRGVLAIFLARFLPGIRSFVPVFAGMSHLLPQHAVLPLAGASAVWYGGLVWLGAFAGRNLEQVLSLLGQVNAWLLAGALAVCVWLLAWWVRTRGHD
jgi:membrane-associated protein